MMRKTLVVIHKEDGSYIRKTLNGLLRGSDRYRVVAVIDVDGTVDATDAGTLLDGQPRDIPIRSSLAEVIGALGAVPDHCTHTWSTGPSGGPVPNDLMVHLLEVLEHGVTLVNPTFFQLGRIPELAAAARRGGAAILDLRKTKPLHEMASWSREVLAVRAPRIPVIGTDQAAGKRTTTRWLTRACDEAGIAAQMIFTGQTGWLQGGQYGLIYDATVAEFVSGELAAEVIRCDRETSPEVIFLEGQSSLTHGCVPLSDALIRPLGSRGVILQHVPSRRFNIDTPQPRLPIDSDIQIVQALGAEVLAITLNGEHEPRGRVLSTEELVDEQEALRDRLGVPVIRPLEEGMDELVSIVRTHVARERSAEAA